MDDASTGISVYTATDDDGEFNFLLGCLESGQISLSVLDPATLTASNEGVFDYYVSVSENLNVGNLSFCDEESAPDFMMFDDGINQITFEEIDFDSEAAGCQDLFAFNSGSPVVDFIEGFDVEIVTLTDSINIVGCGTDPVVVQGYLDTGEYLYYSSTPIPNYNFISTNVIEGEDATLYEGWIYLGQENESVKIYDDETMTVLVDEYFAEFISINYQFIW